MEDYGSLRIMEEHATIASLFSLKGSNNLQSDMCADHC